VGTDFGNFRFSPKDNTRFGGLETIAATPLDGLGQAPCIARTISSARAADRAILFVQRLGLHGYADAQACWEPCYGSSRAGVNHTFIKFIVASAHRSWEAVFIRRPARRGRSNFRHQRAQAAWKIASGSMRQTSLEVNRTYHAIRFSRSSGRAYGT